MLKFKTEDEVVIGEIAFRFDESEGEGRFIGQVGEIIEAIEGNHPYQIRFYDKEIQEINEGMGSRLFDESELNFL